MMEKPSDLKVICNVNMFKHKWTACRCVHSDVDIYDHDRVNIKSDHPYISQTKQTVFHRVLSAMRVNPARLVGNMNFTVITQSLTGCDTPSKSSANMGRNNYLSHSPLLLAFLFGIRGSRDMVLLHNAGFLNECITKIFSTFKLFLHKKEIL